MCARRRTDLQAVCEHSGSGGKDTVEEAGRGEGVVPGRHEAQLRAMNAVRGSIIMFAGWTDGEADARASRGCAQRNARAQQLHRLRTGQYWTEHLLV